MRRRLRIISELYYPEETSTGYFVTGIAEGLARKTNLEVSVICAQPTYSRRGTRAPKDETRAGVRIERLSVPGVDKNKLLGRAWMFSLLTFRFGFRLFRRIRRGDCVMVLTNPPSLPLLVVAIAGLKGATPLLLMHDVYPDVLVPTGLTREGSLIYRSVGALQRWMLHRMARVIVLGRDMQERVGSKLRSGQSAPVIIPNWGDVESITPSARKSNPLRGRLGLTNQFVVQFSGNLGRTHGLDDLVTLAENCRKRNDVTFLVFGWGAGRPWLEEQIKQRSLGNVYLLEPCEREELDVYLTTCDLFLLPMKAGMEGISVPSRLYNVLAAGSPILGVCGKKSELARVVVEENVGWVVPPGEPDALAAALEMAMADPEALEAMGRRARAAAESQYNRDTVIAQFGSLLSQLPK